MRNNTDRATGMTYVGLRSVVLLLCAVCVTFGVLFWGFDRTTESGDAPVASRANAERAPTARVALVTASPLAEPPSGIAGSASATAPQWLKAPTARPNLQPAAATRAVQNSATPAPVIAPVHVGRVVPVYHAIRVPVPARTAVTTSAAAPKPVHVGSVLPVHHATRVPVPARTAVTASAAAPKPVHVGSVLPVPTEPLVMTAHNTALSHLATRPRRQRSEPPSIVSRASLTMHAADRAKTTRAHTPKLAQAISERATQRVSGQNAILVPFAPVTPVANRALEPRRTLREPLLVAPPHLPAPIPSVLPAP